MTSSPDSSGIVGGRASRTIRARRALVALALLVAGAAGSEEAWRPARPDYRWAFPQDHWARPGYRTEWWYFTGHLTAVDDGRVPRVAGDRLASAGGGDGGPPTTERRFGYQLTFFRVGLLPERPALDSDWAAQDLVMGHAAVTDPEGARHLFSEVLYRAVPLLGGFGRYPDPRIAWARAPAGTAGDWTLRWNGAAFDLAMRDDARGFAFRLRTRPLKPLVFQGPNGFSRKGEGPTAASHYYSFTRLGTEGTLTVERRSWAVRGESWMDKEFGSNQLGERQVGWDWFSLQLGDGRELMLYLLRDRGGAVDFARGTIVSAAGRPRYLEPGEWTVRASGRWRSPETGAEYPAGWEIEVPGEGLRLRVVPELGDQENRSRLVRDLFYWEGAVAVSALDGSPRGHGYVELVGYGTRSRPAI